MATVTIEQLSGDDLVSLSAWLKEREEYNRVYGRDEAKGDALDRHNKKLLQDSREHAADAEKEADKLRDALQALVNATVYDVVDVTGFDGNGVFASIDTAKLSPARIAAEKAIKAYDHSPLKMPF